ncbi:hypothetical protein Marpi_2083 [Marinitoga piezophila KA3]|uniref:Uncharacterized protein n=1 Tax=Marinitoga piezophila (strain DSM 14283 / JCM 11233 / KA3) TaxID=443254 RepID=H2J7G5_MARPK|nr:hypothetical protein [Marinitoga piezophila]AEX86458.1 hypothetical protein Marpi_2083 [Marinitoga piezophila KA3]
MGICIKDILNIVEYGYFSKPIVNYIYPKISDVALKYYLLLLKSIWNEDLDKALFYANKVISTTPTIMLRELARFEKIDILLKQNKFEESKKEFIILRKNIKTLSEDARNIILPGLKHISSKYKDNYDYIKVYGKNYNESYAQKSLLKYSQARKNLNDKNYKKAFEIFIEGYFIAKKFPHPTMMNAGLNSAAWWIRKIDKEKALITANLLEYYMGYYYDNLNYTYNWFDTIFEVYKINKYLNLFDISVIVLDYKKNVSFEINPEFENVYNNKSKFRNRRFRKNTSLYFKNNLFKIKKTNISKIPVLFFSTYTTLIEKPFFTKNHILKLIFEGDKNKIIKFFSVNYEKMYFFNVMMSDFDLKKVERRLLNSEDVEDSEYNISPFYLARKKLITELFKKPKNFKEFVFNYFKLSDEEMRIFGVFLRNCVRYDIKWPITPYPKGKVRDFAIKYGLGQKHVVLGYYSFEDDERVLIDDIIERFL